MDRQTSNLYIEQLFSDHQNNLIGYLRKKFNDQDGWAEDIAQEAYIRLHRLDGLSNIKSPKAHLFKTASNLAIDFERREKLQRLYVEKQVDDVAEKACEDTPVRIYDLEAICLKLEDGVNQLPYKCRQALVYHRVHGMEYSDIARELSVSVSSVEKYLVRALGHCRKIIDRN